MEEWRPAPGWEDLYDISSEGRVRSRERTVVFNDGRVRIFPSLIRKPYFDSCGYLKVTLKCQSRQERVLIHHLVTTAWRGPRPEGQVARHLNGNPADCREQNLDWGTYADNYADSVKHGTARRSRKFSESVVASVRAAKGRRVGRRLCAQYGMSPAHVSNIQNGNRRTLP